MKNSRRNIIIAAFVAFLVFLVDRNISIRLVHLPNLSLISNFENKKSDVYLLENPSFFKINSVHRVYHKLHKEIEKKIKNYPNLKFEILIIKNKEQDLTDTGADYKDMVTHDIWFESKIGIISYDGKKITSSIINKWFY